MQGALTTAVVGSPETVRQGLADFVARHQPDEVIVTAQIYDHAARVRSFEILAAAADLTPAVSSRFRGAKTGTH
jgi:alkanesulfonate monooxygenase SsuD/methylene tetrahydromethanopterin reductase-like flavin-dependent oxidoreductase (luciferase family)